MVSASLSRDFDLSDGSNWLLDLLPNSIPNTKNGALWSTQDNTTILAYGGRIPGEHNVPNGNSLPSLDIAGNEWSNSSSPISLYRLTAGASVNIPEMQRAYYIGGFQDASVATDAPQDGLAHYASSMAAFDTQTRTPSLLDAPFLPTQNGAAYYIPVGDGLLIYFGGETPEHNAVNETTATYEPNLWDHVWLYDIKGDKWFNQPTTNAPDPRTEFCGSILYDDVSKTWQVWAIGGADSSSREVLSDVSYLSIPSFEWHRAGRAAALMSTACVNVGPQIMVIGGRNDDSPTGGSDYGSIAYIYDANAQASTSSYTATHTSYIAPSTVRAAAGSTQTPATWGDPALQKLFAATSGSATTTRSTASATATTAGSSEDSDTGLSGGAIAGIAVGVGLVLILTALLAVFCFRRRRQARSSPQELGDTKASEKPPIAEVHADSMRHEMYGGPGKYPSTELP